MLRSLVRLTGSALTKRRVCSKAHLFSRVTQRTAVSRALFSINTAPIVRGYFSTAKPQSARFATWLTETIKEDSVPDEELRELDELLAQKGWKLSLLLNEVQLKKTIGNEEVTVIVPGSEQQEPINYDQQTEATEEGSLVDQEDRFTVKITKQGTERWLEFNCMAKSGVIEVDQILVCTSKAKQEMYFDELSEEAQNEFLEYLKEREIDEEFARVVYLSLNKYDHEYYLEWMKDVKEFVGK